MGLPSLKVSAPPRLSERWITRVVRWLWKGCGPTVFRSPLSAASPLLLVVVSVGTEIHATVLPPLHMWIIFLTVCEAAELNARKASGAWGRDASSRSCWVRVWEDLVTWQTTPPWLCSQLPFCVEPRWTTRLRSPSAACAKDEAQLSSVASTGSLKSFETPDWKHLSENPAQPSLDEIRYFQSNFYFVSKLMYAVLKPTNRGHFFFVGQTLWNYSSKLLVLCPVTILAASLW